ncbi:MAG: hypothetical protein IPM29_21730 [Planctomycetes bacterium]|nr:hypothetical protein [Planctomycetota bacterium]
MRRLSFLAVALAATVCGANAQLSLATLTGGTNQGNVGGGIYFDLQINTTVTITQIDFLCGANTVAGTGVLGVWLGPSTYLGNVTNAALWTSVATATTTVGPSLVANGVLNTPIALGPGNYGVALNSSAFNHGYTNGLTCSSTTIPGSCSNSLFSNAQMTLRAGAAQNAFLTGSVFTPRVFNGVIRYSLGGTPIAVAAWEAFGKGCYGYYRSFYELFPNPASLNVGTGFAVGAIRLGLTPQGYQVTQSSTPLSTPLSAPLAVTTSLQTFSAAASLPNGMPFGIAHPLNGSIVSAPDLEVATTGYIVPAPATTAASATVSNTAFLTGVPRWAVHWKNMNPLVAGGSMYIEQNQTTGAIEVTWQTIADTGFTTTSTFQAAFFPGGDVEYRWGAMSTNGGGGYPVLIGWTEGGGALDPGTREITTTLPFSTQLVDNQPLTLASSGRPVLGSTVQLITTGIPASTLGGAFSLGIVGNPAGLPLAAINMPGCFAYHELLATVTIPMAPPQNQFPLQVPNLTVLNGQRLFGQSISVSPGFNPTGVLTSNGLRLTLGSL